MKIHSLAAAAAKLLQSCPTLCDPIDSSPPGSPIPGILQARTLEWVAISFSMHESEKWKWSHSVVSDSLQPPGLQPTRLLHPWYFSDKSTGVGCHCLLYTALTYSFSYLEPVCCSMSSSLLLPDLHTGFSRGRSGGLVYPSLEEFSTVYCDPHSRRLWHSQ